MIILDVETTGVDPKKHSILSIGAIDFNNQENYFYGECNLKEGALIDDQALTVNGFTVEKIQSNQKNCRELLLEFLEWTKNIQNKTLAGHNVHFDWSFLKEHFEFYNIEWPFKYRLVDLHSVFYYYMLKNNIEIPLKNYSSAISLDTIAEHLKFIKREGYHNALEDARLTAKAFSILINGH